VLGDISGGAPSSTSGGERVGWYQEWQRQRRGGFVSQTKTRSQFTSLLVSYSSGYGNTMASTLAGFVRQDEFHCDGGPKESLNPEKGLQSLQYTPADNTGALPIKSLAST
jgi:hypothetical protein